MNSYCPQTRFAQEPDKWWGGEGIRYATREEAQASLAEIIATRSDLLETRIVASWRKANATWNFEANMEGKPVRRRMWVKKGFKYQE